LLTYSHGRVWSEPGLPGVRQGGTVPGTTVGFIGLGEMGRGMAAGLLRAGCHVRVWNRSPQPVAALVGQGAEAADGIAEAFAAEVVADGGSR